MMLRPPLKLITTREELKGKYRMKQGLFDLREDPEEKTNLAFLRPSAYAQLRALLFERVERSKRIAEAIQPTEGQRGKDAAEMPTDVREALIALGYLDAEGNAGAVGAATEKAPPGDDDSN